MNTAQALTIMALMLTGLATAVATEVEPAWLADGYVMEEVVVTAEAPPSYYMEEIVVTATAPDFLVMEETVVTATIPQAEATVAAVETPAVVQAPAPVIEEIVVTGRLEDLPTRLATRLRFLRSVRHF